MIITKEVEGNLRSIRMEFREIYRINGLKWNEKIIIPIEHLQLGSNTEIEVECSQCKCRKMLRYYVYNDNIKKHNFYTCKGICSQIKNKKTCLELFGKEYYFQ